MKNKCFSSLKKEWEYMDAVVATTQGEEGEMLPVFWEHAVLSWERT